MNSWEINPALYAFRLDLHGCMQVYETANIDLIGRKLNLIFYRLYFMRYPLYIHRTILDSLEAVGLAAPTQLIVTNQVIIALKIVHITQSLLCLLAYIANFSHIQFSNDQFSKRVEHFIYYKISTTCTLKMCVFTDNIFLDVSTKQ